MKKLTLEEINNPSHLTCGNCFEKMEIATGNMVKYKYRCKCGNTKGINEKY